MKLEIPTRFHHGPKALFVVTRLQLNRPDKPMYLGKRGDLLTDGTLTQR